VYEHHAGFIAIHVASSRYVFDESLPRSYYSDQVSDWDAWIEEWIVRARKVSELVNRASLVPIDLPCDGETYEEATYGDAADRLEVLLGFGYHVPQDVIDDLRAEQAEEDAKEETA
jgi:hypothetical protein